MCHIFAIWLSLSRHSLLSSQADPTGKIELIHILMEVDVLHVLKTQLKTHSLSIFMWLDINFLQS